MKNNFTLEEWNSLEVGDIIFDTVGKGNFRKIEAKRYFTCDPTRFFGYQVQSLRPDGNFRNFQGRICQNRKKITLISCDRNRFIPYKCKNVPTIKSQDWEARILRVRETSQNAKSLAEDLEA